MQVRCPFTGQLKGPFFLMLFWLATILAILNPLLRAKEPTRPPVLRSRVYKLKHIAADDAKKLLVNLKIGRDVNKLPGSQPMLIVTSDNSLDMTKATTILRLLDSEKQYEVKTIIEKFDPAGIAKLDRLQAKIANLVIGTFKDPPEGLDKSLAIVDMHNTSLIAIAEAQFIERIIAGVKELAPIAKPAEPAPLPKPGRVAEPNELETKTQIQIAPGESKDKKTAEPDEPTPPKKTETDSLSEALLEVLAEAEKKAEPETIVEPEPDKAEIAKEPEEPKEPETTEDDDAAKFAEIVKKLTEKQDPDESTELQPEDEVKPEPDRPSKITSSSKDDPAKAVKPEPRADRMIIPNAEEELDLTLLLPEKVPITALIELVGKQFGLNYIYDPAQVKGDVMLKVHDGKMKVKETYILLESVLRFKDLVMTRRGNLVTIVPKAKATEYAKVSPDEIRPGDVVIASVFKLENISPDNAITLLRNMKLGLDYEPIYETDTLIVVEYSYRMSRVENILKMVDVPSKERKFQFRKLEYTIATTLAPKIQALAEELGTIKVTITAKATAAKKPVTPTRGSTRRAPPPKPTPKTPRGAPEAKSVYLDTDERTNRILMIGIAEDLDIVNDLIDSLDVEKQDLRTIKEYEIQNVDTSAITDTLFDLGIIDKQPAAGKGIGSFSSSRTRSTPSRTSSTQRAASSTTRAGTAGITSIEELPSDQPQIAVLESTGSLLINATDEQHEQIAKIIAHVDREITETATPFEVYALENQEPVALAAVLQELIQSTILEKSKASTTSSTSKVTASASPTRKQEESNIVIIPEESTYSLIVYANKKNQKLIGDLIKKLDEYRPQVLLDCTLVEISKNDAFQYDLELVSSFPDFDYTSGTLTGLNAIAGTTTDAILGLLDSSPDRNRFIDASSRSGTGRGFYADKHINALLTLMTSRGYGRVLASPKILVDDNQEGSIVTSNTTYVTRETFQDTPSEGGQVITRTSTRDEPYEAGITLTIFPHISKGDNLRLEIELIRTDFGIITGDKPPDTANNKITTVVTVPNNATIILGGMERLNQTKSNTKVPILGDLPLIGPLFTNVDNSDIQKQLYVFVKAHILRPGQDEITEDSDIIKISKKNRIEFEKLETEMQEYEELTGFKPTVMEPLHILEDDITSTEKKD